MKKYSHEHGCKYSNLSINPQHFTLFFAFYKQIFDINQIIFGNIANFKAVFNITAKDSPPPGDTSTPGREQ